jgi:outer membrane biosynthesis protein TonB
MNNKDFLNKIEKHARIVEMHIQRLKKKPDEIHEIDIDMLAEKLKDLYSLVFELETGKAIEEIYEETAEAVAEPVPDPLPEPEPVQEVEPEIEPEPVQEIEPAVEPEPEPDPIPEPEPAMEVVPSPQTEPEPVAEVETPQITNQESEMEAPVEPEEEVLEEPKTTADLFTGTTTIADAFQSREDTSIAARVSPKTVEDLKMAIGINDKFLFINELFKGSPAEYNEAIESLNAAAAITEAETRINDYRAHYDWSDQSEAYNRLKKMVQAKYS